VIFSINSETYCCFKCANQELVQRLTGLVRQQHGGGYGQTNPYESSGRYDQEAGNPYAQKPAYGGRQQQEQQQGAYDGYDNRYGQGQAAGGGGYGKLKQKHTRRVKTNIRLVGGNDVEMTPMNGDSNAFGVPASRDPNAILNECRDIDKGVDSIQRNLERLRFLQQRAIDDPDASQGTATNRELDSLSSDTMTLYRSFAARIKSIKQQKESGDPRNKPQVGMVDRKLKSAINEYQQVDRDFRHKLSAQMERQYRIVRPDASDHEVQEAIQDTSNNQVFSQAVGTLNV